MATSLLLIAAFFMIVAHHMWHHGSRVLALIPLYLAGYILWHNFAVTHTIIAGVLKAFGITAGEFWQLCGGAIFLVVVMIGLRYILGAASRA